MTQAAIKRRMVLDLRAAGLDENQISEQMTALGYKMSQQAVSKMLRRALENMARENQKDVELLREEELYRVNAALQVLWPKVKAGNLKAMREWRAFIDQRARLLGTYAAQQHKVETTVNHRIDPDDKAEIARLEEAFLTAAPELDLPDADVIEEDERALPETTS